MTEFDVAIIGGGCVGSSVGFELKSQMPDLSVAILERTINPVSETSRFNAGILHSGIHEVSGSLKEKLCVEGQALAVSFAEEYGLESLEKTGMMIINPGGLDETVKPEYESRKLRLLSHAAGLSIKTIEVRDATDVQRFCPSINADEAIIVPDVWSIDPAEYSLAILEAAYRLGVAYFGGTEVRNADIRKGSAKLYTSRQNFQARIVINAAGLQADKVGSYLGNHSLQIFPTRGEYFEIRNDAIIERTTMPLHLVLPPNSGKGMHVYKRRGRLFVGPNRQLVDERSNFQKQMSDKDAFLAGARLFFPELQVKDLRFAFAGTRARLVAEDQDTDFRIEQTQDQIIQITGIESPGLTSALAIGKMVSRMVAAKLA